MRVLSWLSLAAAAYAAAVSPLALAPVSADRPSSANQTSAFLVNAVLAAPPAVNTGPHWPLPTHMIQCNPTYARHNVYAWCWAVVRIQIEWIREDGPKFWYLRAGTPHGHVVRVGCCHEAAIVLVAQGRDANGNPAPLQRDVAVSSAEITTMALAVTDACRTNSDRTKGRAWAKGKDFTVEVFYDDYKCGDRCWQGD